MKLKDWWKGIVTFLGAFWYFVWKDDSPKGWVISIIFLFIVIKFIFFPTLSFITGTELPLAIVESCSMYHAGDLFSNYDSWWERHDNKYSDIGISQEQFENYKFKKGFNKGDILFIIGTKPEKLKIGDVIIFNGGRQNPLIHRVISISQKDNEYTFETIGDNNNGQLEIEKSISQDQLVGKAVFKLSPLVGWAKLIFYERGRDESEKGFCDEN